jgi:hypothetical protein
MLIPAELYFPASLGAIAFDGGVVRTRVCNLNVQIVFEWAVFPFGAEGGNHRCEASGLGEKRAGIEERSSTDVGRGREIVLDAVLGTDFPVLFPGGGGK